MVTSPLTLNLDTVHLTDEQFYQLCQNNRDLNFERTTRVELIITTNSRQIRYIPEIEDTAVPFPYRDRSLDGCTS